ncbi:hypothetical protein AB2T63_12130 [Clostridium butyricum]|uniref:hypothetical protein n=1 Tax=Clostridium butyricum TaxID=1492 RepID=UPI000AACA94C|nr:hypothetical protein [Clostridium butyricum]
MDNKKQKKFNVTFRENPKEIELYNWAKEQGQVGGISNYIKRLLLEEKLRQEGK